MIDAYNIMDVFDLPICRNALLFLDGWNYCSPSSVINDYKRVKCYQKQIKVKTELIDQFRSDLIKLNFKEDTYEENSFLQQHLGHRANYVGFGEQIFVAGLKYQTGSYKIDLNGPDRLNKYRERCTLNTNLAIKSNSELAKLNFNVPRLDWVSYKNCQNFNLNGLVTCFCNVIQYCHQYKHIYPKYTPNSTFIRSRFFDRSS